MKIVGLDLSLTATGVARWDGHTETIKTRTEDGDKRLVTIRNQIRGIAHTPLATLAVIEDLPTHAHGAGITGMVHGVVRAMLLSHDVAYVLVPPATLKKFACGKGNATKPDMRMALFQRAGIDNRDDNQVDAAWLRYLGLHLVGEPQLDLPKTHLAALDKVHLPEGFGHAR